MERPRMPDLDKVPEKCRIALLFDQVELVSRQKAIEVLFGGIFCQILWVVGWRNGQSTNNIRNFLDSEDGGWPMGGVG